MFIKWVNETRAQISWGIWIEVPVYVYFVYLLKESQATSGVIFPFLKYNVFGAIKQVCALYTEN
jgi:hypothetical protein